MKIGYYSDIGARNNNEDFIAFSDSVFTLCDGVGGKTKGEVASKFVADSIIQKTNGVDRSSFSSNWVQKMIIEVQDEINKSLIENPEYMGMGTTLCAVLIANQEVLLSHIGDSRIYVVKPRERKYWRSTDHSTVAELLQSGIITDEEAINHRRRNQITRAIQAIPEIETSQADISTLTKIENSDLIFMCSDGVMEAFNDSQLVDILCNTNLEPSAKIELIKLKCLSVSSDNHSAILVEFEDEDQMNSLAEDNLNWIYLPSAENIDKNRKVNKQSKIINEANAHIKQKNHKIIKIAFYMFVITIIAFLAIAMLKT